MGFKHIRRFAGPPTLAPEHTGDHWIDTLNKKHYMSVGTSSVADWALTDNSNHPAFKTISTPLGTSPSASGDSDTLIYKSSSGSVGITGNSSTKEVEFNTIDSNINHDALQNHDPARHKLESELDHDGIQNNGGPGSHASLAAHVASNANPHSVSLSQTVSQDPGTDISASELETLSDGSQADSLHQHDHDALINYDAAEHFKQTDIDHNNLINKGANNHLQIDNAIIASSSHISSQSNPHQTTLTAALAADGGTSATTAEIEELRSGNATVLHTHAGASPPDVYIPLGGNTVPYLETTSGTYQVLESFEYPGTTIAGTPSNIRIYVASNHATNTADFRIYDLTNLQVVAELTGHAGTTFTMQDMGALSSLSATPVIWEIQGLRSVNPARAQIGAIRIVQ